MEQKNQDALIKLWLKRKMIRDEAQGRVMIAKALKTAQALKELQ
jgi:hypothetical protein